MSATLLAFAVALTLSAGATPGVRRLALRIGFTDAPSGRKAHAEPIPLLGGAAIWAAVVIAVVALVDRQVIGELAGMVGGATLVGVLGLVDDRWPLSAPLKLVGQLLGAAVLVTAGVAIQLTGVAALDIGLSVLWVVVVTNAFNFEDNMDGVAAGLAAVAAATLVLLAVANGQLLVAPLAAAVLGASLGFLLYNVSPASIFMGDGGSQFLGFILAALAIKLRFPGRPTIDTWIVPVLVMAPVLFDLALVVTARTRRRVNPFTTAGHDHLSHRLLARGATPREAALVQWLMGCAAGGLALLASFRAAGGHVVSWALLAAVLVGGMLAIRRLEWSSVPAQSVEP